MAQISFLSHLLLIPIVGAEIQFIFHDDFCLPESSPITTPRQADPGPGAWDVVETDGSFSISDSRLQYVAQTTPSTNDLRLYTGTNDRTDVALVMAVIDIEGDFVNLGEWFGLSNDTLISTTDFSALSWIGGSSMFSYPSATLIPEGMMADDTYYLSAVGIIGYLYRLRAGIVSLLFVEDITTIADDVYTIFSNRGATGSIESIRLASLSTGLFEASINIVSPVAGDGSVSGGDPILPSADFVMQVTITSEPSAGDNDFIFRRQDADNYWLRRITSTGDVELYEVVATVPTLRGSGAGAFALGETCTMIVVDETIIIYSDASTEITYASAVNFKTEVNWEYDTIGTSGDEDNLKIWERNASGALSNMLKEMADSFNCDIRAFDDGFDGGFS